MSRLIERDFRSQLTMLRDLLESGGVPLVRTIEDRVRQTTHGRIRDLVVEEVQGEVVVRGQVSSHHTRQLALQGALELLPGKSIRACIEVGQRPR
jgi:hypothetical protein